MSRPFVPITPSAGWHPRYTFSAAVRAGDFVFISGMTAADGNGQLIGEGDIVRQTEYIFEKMARILADAGLTFADIVETTEYFTTLDGYAKTADVRRRVFGGGPYPAATGVMVAGLIRPGALIEIKATAVVSGTATIQD
ncbi:MAG: RidA family protein [Proteobacteria bacterium]|nr:RidA family protein [Burkholderiales bacterium]